MGCCRVLCRSCGGGITEKAPLPAFRCLGCLLGDDYQSLSEPGDTRLPLATRLLRGRMHLHTLGKRASSRTSEQGGLRAYRAFCMELGLAPFPASPGMVQDFMIYGLAVKGWDSTTVTNRVLAIGSYYQYIRNRLGLRHVRSPLRDPETIETGRVVGVNFKKDGGGRLPLAFAELHGLFARGLIGRTRRGRWARLYAEILNFLMLRDTAATHLRLLYHITTEENGQDKVAFEPDSEIRVYYDVAYGADVVQVAVHEDKNVDSRRAAGGGRKSHAPAKLPNFGVDFGADLVDYILYVRPPTGSRLLARPDAKTSGFQTSIFKGFSKSYLQPSYKTAFPDVSPDYLKRIGTHSGRLTLAQLLWNQGFERRLIADAGGWFIKREAVDLYFATAALHIIRAVAALDFTEAHRPGYADA